MNRTQATRKPKVLVVDDDTNILSAFKDYLKAKDCRMVGMSDANLALNAVMKDRFDLVISDVRLNFQSGVTFLLRAKEAHPALPFIVITGYPDFITNHDLRTYGANHILMKPIELNQLNRAIDNCLGWNGRRVSAS